MKADPKIKKLWCIFIATLVATLIAGFFVDLHGHFSVDNYAIFYAVYGFGSCMAIIIFSKFLGIFLKRKEDYYKEND